MTKDNLTKGVLVLLSSYLIAQPGFSLPRRGVFFRENKGQVRDQYGKARSDVLFSGKTGNLVYHLQADGLHYQLYHLECPFTSYSALRDQRGNTGAMGVKHIYRVDVRFIGSLTPCIEATDTMIGYENFYTGWGDNSAALFVRSYKKIRYKEVWPSIDILFYEGEQGLEYDFEVEPGGDPTQIQMEIRGAEMKIEGGELVLRTPYGEIREGKPRAWSQGKEVEIEWEIKGARVGFKVKGRDLACALRIDPPVRVWGTYYGGPEGTGGIACVAHGPGAVYLAGWTDSEENIATLGAHQVDYGSVASGFGFYDAFLVKFDAAGVRQWATYYGGLGSDEATTCTVDGAGNVYIGGVTSSSNVGVLVTAGTHQTFYGGGDFDGFLARFSPMGVLQWGTLYGGGDRDVITSCAVGPSGAIYVAGYTYSTDRIATAGAHKVVPTCTPTSCKEAFLARFSGTGNLVWGTYFGGEQGDEANGCAVDAAGNVYIAGWTHSTGGVATGGVHQSTMGGVSDAFLAKFNGNGSLMWGTYFGGGASDVGRSCTVDGLGNIYLVGYTQSSSGIATPGTHQTAFLGGAPPILSDGFVAKFTTMGGLLWGSYLGGTGGDQLYSCVHDGTNGVYVAGLTLSDGLGTAAAHQPSRIGGMEAVLARFDATGNLLWCTYYGGNFLDEGRSCTTDGAGFVYLAGITQSRTGISTSGAHQEGLYWDSSHEHAFLVKFCDGNWNGTACIPLLYSEEDLIVPSEDEVYRSWWVNFFPSEGYIEVGASSAVVLEVFDVSGRLVDRWFLERGERRVQPWRFSPGVYLIRDLEGTQVLRFSSLP